MITTTKGVQGWNTEHSGVRRQEGGKTIQPTLFPFSPYFIRSPFSTFLTLPLLLMSCLLNLSALLIFSCILAHTWAIVVLYIGINMKGSIWRFQHIRNDLKITAP